MRQREMSLREQALVDEAVTRVCRTMHVNEQNSEFRQLGWEAVLSAYREDAESFFAPELQGWQRAYRLAQDAIAKEYQAVGRLLYQNISLDKPIANEDTETTLAELLQAPHGGFENGVCLHEYLSHMPMDVQRMARGLMEGDAFDEIRGYYHWSADHTFWVYNTLRAAMKAYTQI